MSLSKKKILFVFILVACVLGIQGAKINRPYTGHFATYQGTVMGGMAQNFLREDFKELHLPKTNTIIGGKRSLHLNQYPIPSVIAAVGVKVFGGGLEFWGRFQAILFNLFSLLLVALIAKRLFNQEIAWIAATLYALSPYTLTYGQSFMSEASALAFLLTAVYLSLPEEGTDKKPLWQTMLAGLFFSLVLVSRIHWIVFGLLFLSVYLCFRISRRWTHLFTFGLCSLPVAILWYGHTYFAALQADNVHTSLFMQLASKSGGSMSVWTNAAFYQRLGIAILGRVITPILIPFFIVGLFKADRKNPASWIVLAGITSTLLVVLLAPQKVMSHDFYLYGGYPFFALMAALGINASRKMISSFNSKSIVSLFLLAYLLTSVRFFINPIFKSDPKELHSVNVAKRAHQIAGAEDQLIVLSNGPGVIVFYGGRPSWVIQPNAIGRPLAGYQKALDFSGNDAEELSQLEIAMQDALSWFLHLKSLGGGDVLVIPHPEELRRESRLWRYLEVRYPDVADAQAEYYLLRL